jgi:hypothetical protein
MNHIALGENRTSASHTWHAPALQGQLPKLTLNTYTQPLCLLVKKGTCSRRTDSIQREVLNCAVLLARGQKNQLTILAPHFNNCRLIQAGVQVTHCRCLGRHFVNERDA